MNFGFLEINIIRKPFLKIVNSSRKRATFLLIKCDETSFLTHTQIFEKFLKITFFRSMVQLVVHPRSMNGWCKKERTNKSSKKCKKFAHMKHIYSDLKLFKKHMMSAFANTGLGKIILIDSFGIGISSETFEENERTADATPLF